MRYLEARLDQPDWMRHPMQEFLVASPAMHRAELRAWNLSREDVQFALFYMEGDVDAYRDRIADVEVNRWYELTPVDDDAFYSYVCQGYTDADEAFFGAFAELSLVVVPPLVYDDRGRTTVTVVGRGESLGELVDALRAGADVSVEVLEVGEYDRRHGTVTAGLTDRQREAVATATGMGYYDAPRGASLAEVAAALDVGSGTASELLRRGEAALMGRLFGRDG